MAGCAFVSSLRAAAAGCCAVEEEESSKPGTAEECAGIARCCVVVGVRVFSQKEKKEYRGGKRPSFFASLRACVREEAMSW